eukprot:Opistho-2@942
MKNALRLSAAAAVVLAFAAPAFAQKPITKPPVASILTWTEKQQLERYPNIESVYAVAQIKKGDKVHELPAGTAVDPKVKFGSKTSTVDAFMKDNRITGVIAIKDGRSSSRNTPSAASPPTAGHRFPSPSPSPPRSSAPP